MTSPEQGSSATTGPELNHLSSEHTGFELAELDHSGHDTDVAGQLPESIFENAFDLELFKEQLDWKILLFLAVAAVILIVGKLINQKLAGYSFNKQITKHSNKAVAASFTGFLLSLCIIISGVLEADWIIPDNLPLEKSWMVRLEKTALWSSIGVTLLLISRVINDKLILHKFNNKKELLEDKNVGVGLVQAGSYISTALVIRATVSSPVDLDFANGLLLVGVWFSITQASLILYTKLYQLVTPFDIHKELRNNNVAVGLGFFGSMMAFSILMSFYISTFDSLLGLLLWAIVSAAILMMVRFIVGKILLPPRHFDEDICKDANWGVSAIEAVTAIGAALIIAGVFK